jgi:hypothetical protein
VIIGAGEAAPVIFGKVPTIPQLSGFSRSRLAGTEAGLHLIQVVSKGIFLCFAWVRQRGALYIYGGVDSLGF